MNLNDCDSRQGLLVEKNRYNENNKEYEEEYVFLKNNKNRSNSIGIFNRHNRLSKKSNRKVSFMQNSINNTNNNISHLEDLNNYNFRSSKSNIIEKLLPSSLNNLDNYEDNKTNKGINLLNLTVKIYENDEHFQKQIITKKSRKKVSFDKTVNFENKLKKKSSKVIGNSDNKTFLSQNDYKEAVEERKKNKKKRQSYIVRNKAKNYFGNFGKVKFWKSSGEKLFYDARKSNIAINFENNDILKKNKSKKIFHINPLKKDLNPTSNLDKNSRSKAIKLNKKNKVTNEEVKNQEKEDKFINKKTDIANNEIINAEKDNNNEQNTAKEIKEINFIKKDCCEKTKKKRNSCLLCCLNSKFDDSQEFK